MLQEVATMEAEVTERVITPIQHKERKLKAKGLSIATTNVLLGLLLPVVIVVIWELAGVMGKLNPILLPRPSQILNELVALTSSGELAYHLGISTWRALLGFVIGGGLGLVMGTWVGFSYRTERLLDPSLQMLRTLPHLAIAPLFILWFGFGETSKLLLIAKGAFFPLYVNTFLGIRSVDTKLFDVGRVLEFSRWQLITKLIIPAALPNILLGIRLSIGVAWLGLVVAELMGASAGIGYLINDARSFSWTEVVFVGIIVFAIVGKLSDSIVKWFEIRLHRWQDSYGKER